MKTRQAIVLAAAAVLVASVARSGHEQPVYPSYYPHEIEIKTIAPQAAADLVQAGKLHAYVGNVPDPGTPQPNTIGAVESLGSVVVIRLNPNAPAAGNKASACALIEAVIRDVAARADGSGLVVHPYPVTPWHGDYLNHADLAEAARQRILQAATAAAPADFRLRGEGALAKKLVRPERLTDGPEWDAAIEEISVAALMANSTIGVNGWLGPGWVRSGWFHAYRALSDAMRDPVDKQANAARVARLRTADYPGVAERINLERELVRALTSDCQALVAGYTVKREIFNSGFSSGIENISFNSIEGFHSAMFLRTVKLKDFPWNGWLQLGIAAQPDSAWNPVAGFTDPFGRFAWYAITDPAAIPSPYESGWTLNRITDVEASPRK